MITISEIIVWIGNTKEVCYFNWGNVTRLVLKKPTVYICTNIAAFPCFLTPLTAEERGGELIKIMNCLRETRCSPAPHKS